MGFRDGAANHEPRWQNYARDYLPGLNEEQRTQVYYYAIYPNLLLSLHPELHDGAYAMGRKRPIAPKSSANGTFIQPKWAKPDFQCSDAIDFWDLTNREGLGHLRAVAGKESARAAYKPGPYSTREGALTRPFDEMVLDPRSPIKKRRPPLRLWRTAGKTLCRGGRHGHVPPLRSLHKKLVEQRSVDRVDMAKNPDSRLPSILRYSSHRSSRCRGFAI